MVLRQEPRMNETSRDVQMRIAAFDHVRRLMQVHDLLTAVELKPGFIFEDERIPLINPQRGIFKPQQMQYLLSIKTVFPRPGGRVWYDDQREVHRQIFEGSETIDYAFMGRDPDAADNRWLRDAFENQIPIIYFLGIAPGRYQPMLPTFICGGDGKALRPSCSKAKAPPSIVPRSRYHRLQRPLRAIGSTRTSFARCGSYRGGQ